jgi:hypothetical protein
MTRNIGTQLVEPILMFTQGAQTYDAGEEEKQEVLIANEGGVNLSQMLENRSPPKVDKRKLGMSQGEVIRGRHLIVRFRF